MLAASWVASPRWGKKQSRHKRSCFADISEEPPVFRGDLPIAYPSHLRFSIYTFHRISVCWQPTCEAEVQDVPSTLRRFEYFKGRLAIWEFPGKCLRHVSVVVASAKTHPHVTNPGQNARWELVVHRLHWLQLSWRYYLMDKFSRLQSSPAVS